MKKLLAAAALLALLPLTANAADLPAKAAPYAAPAWNWTGGYVGLVGTVGSMSSEHADQWCDLTCSTPALRAFGGGVGGTLGYNWQVARHFMWGLEGDVSWASFKTNHFEAGRTYSENIGAKWDWYSTIRGRAGVVVDEALVYATAGVAFVGTKYSALYNDGSGFGNTNTTQTGFAVGGGVEYALSKNLSFKAEYLYIGLPDKKSGDYRNANGTVTNFPGEYFMTHRSDAQMARLGLNWRPW